MKRNPQNTTEERRKQKKGLHTVYVLQLSPHCRVCESECAVAVRVAAHVHVGGAALVHEPGLITLVGKQTVDLFVYFDGFEQQP